MEINEFIKSLSLQDTKTLSQKVLKTTEELGELSRVALPFDSAAGTNHRFVDKESILEEIVDLYLCNISIFHSLGFSQEEFNEMLVRKSEKWSELQSREKKSEFPLPFEIHITIDASDVNSVGFIEKYREDCKNIGVKPIVLDLEINDGYILKDVMTSSHFFGDNRGSFEESERISNDLTKLGYKVIRKKIETVPWHPAVPQVKSNRELPKGCYFEAHIGIIISPNEKEMLDYFVKSDLKKYGNFEGTSKLSQNYFKKSKNGEDFVNMLTYRSYFPSYEVFERELNVIKEALTENNFKFEKVISEYSIYDTNITHDSKWIVGS